MRHDGWKRLKDDKNNKVPPGFAVPGAEVGKALDKYHAAFKDGPAHAAANKKGAEDLLKVLRKYIEKVPKNLEKFKGHVKELVTAVVTRIESFEQQEADVKKFDELLKQFAKDVSELKPGPGGTDFVGGSIGPLRPLFTAAEKLELDNCILDEKLAWGNAWSEAARGRAEHDQAIVNSEVGELRKLAVTIVQKLTHAKSS
jgi:hypothetical protein